MLHLSVKTLIPPLMLWRTEVGMGPLTGLQPHSPYAASHDALCVLTPVNRGQH